jgi:hypothetical protein
MVRLDSHHTARLGTDMSREFMIDDDVDPPSALLFLAPSKCQKGSGRSMEGGIIKSGK